MATHDRSSSTAVPRERLAYVALVAAAYLVNVCLSGLAVIDDAYITFRHATNLAEHGQLVFNLGERVEGITDLLWALILAGCVRVLGTPMVETSVVIALLLVPWSLFRVYQICRTLTGNERWGAVGALSLALNPHFVLATTNGLEAGLYAALLAELCFRVMRGQFRACDVLITLLFLTRPDGVSLMAATAVAIRMKTGRWHTVLPTLAVMTAGVLAATAFRWSYYGHLVPNSIVAKSYPLDAAPGVLFAALRYSLSFAAINGYFLLPLGVLAYRYWRSRCLPGGEMRPMVIFCSSALVVSWVVTIRNGGDWMPHYRLFFQYGPIWAIAATLVLADAKVELRRVALVGAWPAALLAFSAFANRATSWRLDTSDAFYNESTRRLAGKLSAADVVSAEAVGYISYHLPHTVFHDPLGLNDLYIARHGTPAIRFGKENESYTLGVVSPAIAVWHTGSHLDRVPNRILSHYEVRRFGKASGWQSKVICIRRDRAPELSPAFADWPLIESSVTASN